MHRTIQQTADGSPTLFVPELDEHYHSVKGARTMDIDSFTESLQQEDLNETALRVLNLLFILNASATPLSTEQILQDSDLGYGSANRASDLKKFKRDREKLAEHGVSIVEVRPAGAKQTEESLWTIDRANT